MRRSQTTDVMDEAEGLSVRAGETKDIQGPLRTPPGRCGARSVHRSPLSTSSTSNFWCCSRLTTVALLVVLTPRGRLSVRLLKHPVTKTPKTPPFTTRNAHAHDRFHDHLSDFVKLWRTQTPRSTWTRSLTDFWKVSGQSAMDALECLTQRAGAVGSARQPSREAGAACRV